MVSTPGGHFYELSEEYLPYVRLMDREVLFSLFFLSEYFFKAGQKNRQSCCFSSVFFICRISSRILRRFYVVRHLRWIFLRKARSFPILRHATFVKTVFRFVPNDFRFSI